MIRRLLGGAGATDATRPAAPAEWVWPLRLEGRTPTGHAVALRPLTTADARDFQSVRRANADWLEPWDATSPAPDAPPRTYDELVTSYDEDGRAGRGLPLAVESDGRVVGQVNVGTIVYGSFRSCYVGYWVSREVAGRMLVPTGVALVGDHLFGRVRLHRMEINIRPENAASLAVVRKLGFREEGTRPHYLHIDGAWRTHLSFALTAEDLGGETFVERLHRLHRQKQSSHESLLRHTDPGQPPRDGPPLPS